MPRRHGWVYNPDMKKDFNILIRGIPISSPLKSWVIVSVVGVSRLYRTRWTIEGLVRPHSVGGNNQE